MLITNETEADAAIRELQNSPGTIYSDTETNGIEWWKARVVGWCLGNEEKEFYFPVRHGEGYNLPESYARRIPAEVLPPEREQTGHNYASDLKWSAKDGLQMPERIWDTMLAAHLMNENEDAFKMEHLAAKYLDPSYANAEEELTAELVARFKCSEKRSKAHLWKLPASKVAEYGCQDIRSTRGLRHFYEPELATWKLDGIAEEVNDFQRMVVDMEMRGMLIDRDALTALGEKAGPKAQELEAQIKAQAKADLGDMDFPGNPDSEAQMKCWLRTTTATNPRSHPQMKCWLGTMLGVPNTKAGTLKRSDDPRAAMLLQHRMWQKLKSSFVDPYWGFMDEEDYIHPSLWICSPGTREGKDVHGTVSGRLSATKPNAQQVPDAARHLFIAPEGYELVELDYSQAELRLAAHYYWIRFKDGNLANMLVEGRDLHQAMADACGISRKLAKIRNFAIQYGAGARRLAFMFQTSVAAEQRYLNAYYRMFPGCGKLQRLMTHLAEEHGYIRMWSGRTRRYNCVRAASYKASNNLIQGGVAEMVRRAGTRCWKEVPQALPFLQVHDSYLFLIRKGPELMPTIRQLRAIMQDQPWCELPMVVDCKIGRNWGDMKELPRDPVGIPAAVLAKVTDETLLAAAV